jgi:hypothetical protein
MPAARSSRMLTWERMMDRHPAGHLLTGIIRGKDRIDRVRLLTRLVEAAAPKGDWAVTKTRDRDIDLVQVAFARPEDAKRIGDGLTAVRGAGQPGRASHRQFLFDTTMAEKITALLDA